MIFFQILKTCKKNIKTKNLKNKTKRNSIKYQLKTIKNFFKNF